MSAITAAGVTYAITRACTMGDLSGCACGKNDRPRHNHKRNKPERNRHGNPKVMASQTGKLGSKNIILPEGDWKWGGCGDNVHFGSRKSKAFLDAKYTQRSDIATLVKLHNNNVGRLVRPFSRFLLFVYRLIHPLRRPLGISCASNANATDCLDRAR